MNIKIDVKGMKDLRAFLDELQGLPEEQEALSVLARAGQNKVKEHLYKKDSEPNKMGAPKTHYYRKAGDSTSGKVQGKNALVEVKQIGIRQRLLGGVITPKQSKYLTIPLNKIARGRRASEFDNLQVRGKALGREVGGQFQALYALKKSVNQKADPTVLPTEQELLITATGEVVEWISTRLA